MSTAQDLRTRTEEFLKSPPNNLPVKVPVAGGLEALGPTPQTTDFSVFIPAQARHAIELAGRFMALADANPGEQGLLDVLEEAERVAQTENDELVKYALMVFITHHPEGRSLPIPSLAERSPEAILPSNQAVLHGLEGLGALGAEAQLDYFREDTAVNDHHSRWHIVYPVFDPNNPSAPAKNRQGELFWYMHQQMLARYDAERKAFNLSPTQELKNYAQQIAEGYEANLPNFSDRLPNEVMHDIDGYTMAEHDQSRQHLLDAAQSGVLKTPGGDEQFKTVELLSCTAESNVGSVNAVFYGSHHNMGHMLLASLPDPNGPFPDRLGVMRSTATAVRDPVFFRWHRHVDETMYVWQQTLKPNDLKTGTPQVRIRKNLQGAVVANQSPDILVCMQKDIASASDPTFDGQKFADATFGGANWDKPLSSFGIGNGELHTMMGNEKINLPGGGTGNKPYLDHEEFYYFLRLENLLDQPQKVTVRIFIVASEFADERRQWIEMDKFAQSLDAKQKAVVFRPARFSAVVRKPARRPKDPQPQPHAGDDPNYCDCGWPYHLLLPRGNQSGMDFRLMVMLTDYQADLVGAEKKCGSMSFCGVKDADYPDKRPMGYPFDRPFDAKISDVLSRPELVNIATKDLKIKHVKV